MLVRTRGNLGSESGTSVLERVQCVQPPVLHTQGAKHVPTVLMHTGLSYLNSNLLTISRNPGMPQETEDNPNASTVTRALCDFSVLQSWCQDARARVPPGYDVQGQGPVVAGSLWLAEDPGRA